MNKDEEKQRLLILLRSLTPEEINQVIEEKGKSPKLRSPFVPVKK